MDGHPPVGRGDAVQDDPKAVEQVRNATTGVISGVKVIVKEPFR